MPSLKEFRQRIASVKSTQKITAAMMMVAAAKLRRAQEAAEAARPYADRMDCMLGALAGSVGGQAGAPPLLAGTGKTDSYLLVIATSDRGLCGGFNSTIVRAARRRIVALQRDGKTVKLFCVGRKAADVLNREYGALIIERVSGIDRPRLEFARAREIAQRLDSLYSDGAFDVCAIFYNRFKSALTQVTTEQQLIPFAVPEVSDQAAAGVAGVYEYEPAEDEILADLLPRNLSVQVFRALLENQASEHGARMTAMDSATRNAGDMIDRLALSYNRTRQAAITKELIEIISGAEAV